MTVTYMNGFEGKVAAVDDSPGSFALSGTCAYSTTQARTGVSSIRCNPSSGASGVLTSAQSGWLHFGLYIATLPSVARHFCGLSSAGDGLYLNSDGTITAKENSSTIGTTATALSTATWYWIGYRIGTFNAVIFQINGVDQVSGNVAAGGSNIGFGGTEASAVDAYIDDIITDDTGFLRSSKVDTAFPISDNTVTGVTDNNGVTTNIWQCVSNAPPGGVASANEAANAKKGMHFTASVTDNYIANLETYTTLGVGASDTVLAVQSLVRQGEDIATGTKTMQNVGALTNPTVAGATITVGGDAGAHGAEAGLWVTTVGTLTTSPSVTVGSSPTIRASRVSESRLACVDFMGMVVAWTPAAVVANPSYTSPYPPLLAQ